MRASKSVSASGCMLSATPVKRAQLASSSFQPEVKVWMSCVISICRGSVVASWLLDLTAHALSQNHDLSDFEGRVSDSGEGRWTVHAAVDEGVPADVLSAALYARFTSRGQADFADKILSAMRKEFGGHDEKPDDGTAARS